MLLEAEEVLESFLLIFGEPLSFFSGGGLDYVVTVGASLGPGLRVSSHFGIFAIFAIFRRSQPVAAYSPTGLWAAFGWIVDKEESHSAILAWKLAKSYRFQ